ncbi:MAG: aminotransferase class IV [Spirochaetaceae bacterium]|jgi:D-alanine transaminase|nr:aminotransferase class IV [Spirochaetaceae bacterium]
MKNLGYYNGAFGLIEEMTVPMNDRACWFGDGVYDATLSANYRIFALDEHIDRFFRSAELLGMRPAQRKDELASLLYDLVRKVDSPDQFVYWQLTRGVAERAHAFPEGAVPNLWVMLKPLALPLPNSSQKVRLITVEDTRFFHCHIKTLNLIPNVLASERAKREGSYEAVFHRGERVTECSHCNVHIFRNGAFQSAPTDNLILPGITRAHLIRHCGDLGIPVREEAFTVREMMEADEVMISGSTTFCRAASHIDNVPVGGKAPEMLRSLNDALIDEFRRSTAGAGGT